MKYHRMLCIYLFATILHNVCLGQITSLEFTQKTPELMSPLSMIYYPKLQVMNDTLFVCSSTGIYQKDMLRNSEWKLYAFDGTPIIEFVRNGSMVLANALSTTEGQDSLLLLSRDGGKTYEDYTFPCFWKYGKNHLYRISQNPQNLNSILTCTTCDGIYGSKNFGKNWENFYPYSLGINIAYVNYHPLDTATIFYTGEALAFNGIIYKSSDNGITWGEYEVPGGDNCVHQIDFHPTDPNILIFGGEGVIGKSIDKGETWQIKNLHESSIYFYKVLFDKNAPDTIYACGACAYNRDNQDTIFVYRSTDTGETWHLAYKEYLGVNGGEMIDMVKYKNKLIFYTRELGVLQLDLKTTPVVFLKDVSVKRDLTVCPNPVVRTMHFQTGKIIQRVDLIDSMGIMVQSSLLVRDEKSVDVSRLSEGIYLAVFYAGGQIMVKKICIARQH